ncbi:MAG: PDZ domain-containing protein [Bacteroidetes bacterium]|nr:PDZ domain-containing protein [Bacteroidota bacterium]
MPRFFTRPQLSVRRLLVPGGALALLAVGTLGFRAADAPLDLIRSAFATIYQSYVDDVPVDRVVEHGIQTMLKELDPHSTYLTVSEMRRVRDEFNAGFEGIGIAFERLTGTPDTAAVQSVLPGGPSEAAGLLPGDRLLRADGKSLLGLPDSLIVRTLRGPGGSSLELQVQRYGEPSPRTVRITRGRIPVNSVEAAYLIDDETGYVRLVRFSRTTTDEVRDALSRLSTMGMKRAVLDLRGNGGGYLDQAVRISDLFLPSGKTVVTQQGRTTQVFKTERGNEFEALPLIVLVDGSSASASEIVAGAMQDQDRALLVGRRTFGKGLVQQQRELVDGSAIRVTIARFLTPSGRLIQTPYTRGETPEEYYASKRDRQSRDRNLRLEALLSEVPDSLKYRTPAGRIVIGGGGILPDVLVTDTLGTATAVVLRQGLIDRWVRSFVYSRATALRSGYRDGSAFVASYRIAPEDYNAFLDYTSTNLADDRTSAATWRSRLDLERLELDALLRGRIAGRVFDRESSLRLYNVRDRTLEEAMRHWPEATAMAR